MMARVFSNSAILFQKGSLTDARVHQFGKAGSTVSFSLSLLPQYWNYRALGLGFYVGAGDPNYACMTTLYRLSCFPNP